MRSVLFQILFLTLIGVSAGSSAERPRLREFGIKTGVLQPGPLNAITDVIGVKVGHITMIEGRDVRTGVTAILPHEGNIFQDKVPAAVYVANAFGKLTGSTQVEKTITGAISDLQPGMQVMVTGQKDASGNITARQVSILNINPIDTNNPSATGTAP